MLKVGTVLHNEGGCHPRGDCNGIPALAFLGIWGMSQWVQDPSLPFRIFLKALQSFKNKIQTQRIASLPKFPQEQDLARELPVAVSCG